MLKSLEEWFAARKERKQRLTELRKEASKRIGYPLKHLSLEELEEMFKGRPSEEPKKVDPKDRFSWGGNPQSLIPFEIAREDYAKLPDVVLMSEEEVNGLLVEANIGKVFRAGDGHICRICKGDDMDVRQWGAGLLCGPPDIGVTRYAPVFDRVVTVPVSPRLKPQGSS